MSETFNLPYDAVDQAECRVLFLNAAVCALGEVQAACPLSPRAWEGLYYVTQDILDVLAEAKRLMA